MTSLFYTYVLTLKQEICEADLFRFNLKFEAISNRGYLHSTQERLLSCPNTDIQDPSLVVKNPYSGLWLYSEKSILDSAASNTSPDCH